MIPDLESYPDIPVDFADAPNHDGGFLPYLRTRRHWRGRGRFPGLPASSTGSAASRRRTGPATSRTTPTTMTTWSGSAPAKSRASPRTSRTSPLTRRAARSCSSSAGAGPPGPVAAACAGGAGGKVAHAHLSYLNPFPRNTGDVLRRYEKILVPEMNLGQLLKLVRAEFLVDAVGYNRVRGLRSGRRSWLKPWRGCCETATRTRSDARRPGLGLRRWRRRRRRWGWRKRRRGGDGPSASRSKSRTAPAIPAPPSCTRARPRRT